MIQRSIFGLKSSRRSQKWPADRLCQMKFPLPLAPWTDLINLFNATALLAEFLEMQAKSVEKLQKLAASAEKSKADTKADNKKVFVSPRNREITNLAVYLNRRPEGMSMKQSALEYTKNDERRAASLLRQLRRYPAFQSLAKGIG